MRALVAGHVEAPLPPVALEVLPEIGELQRGAHGVGCAVALIVRAAGHAQHQPSDRVRRAPAVVHQLRPRRVALRVDVLAKGGEQILEQLDGKRAGTDGVAEGEEDGVGLGLGVRDWG